jgi:hypothetical protein
MFRNRPSKKDDEVELIFALEEAVNLFSLNWI